MLNKIWDKGRLPKKWKTAIVIPILKPNKDRNNINSYRPISLTNNTCKIMETIITNRLKHYVESNNLISKNQCDFRNKRSTTYQLIRS